MRTSAVRAVATGGALAALALGCNEGGVMELELLLPPAPEAVDIGPCGGAAACPDGTCEGGRCIYRGAWFSQVEITSDFDFVDEDGAPVQWGLEALPSVPLAAGTEGRYSCTSVVGTEAAEVLRVRLRYCRNDQCVETLEDDTIQHWYEIESPFYEGKRTYVRRRAPALVPEVPICSDDAECVGPEGPVCLSGGQCGCADDGDCAGGHCEGAASGRGRCINDIGECFVSGCFRSDRLLDGPDLCLGSDPRVHACAEQPSLDYEPVNCYVP